MDASETVAAGLKKLREPFPANQISKLCKPTKRDNPKGKCSVCGGWHALPSVALDYVGHAALTDRLLDADPLWNWEPVATNPDGSPVVDKDGGMWIRLTVCGVTRLGYGDSDGKVGPSATKERIGDALRNAAMRFGAALDLWHKGDLHKEVPADDDTREGDKTAAAVAEILDAPDLATLQPIFAEHYRTAKQSGNKAMEKAVTSAYNQQKAKFAEAV